jgi:type VI secretion system protein ImpA
LYDEAIAEGKISGEMYAAAMAETPPDHLVELRADVAACIAAMQRLRDVCALRMQDDPPAFGKLQDTLSKLSEVVGDATQARGIANIAPNGSIEAGAGNGAEISAQAIARPGGNIAFVASTGNSLASRQQALALLEQISSYFKASEPHSPIPLLIDRAVKWARLPLPEGAPGTRRG